MIGKDWKTMDYAAESLKKHKEWKGKIEVICRAPLETRDDLSLAYTPGVAQPCLEIQKDVNMSYELTRRSNLVAVVTDGTAVLGLGDIGPEAGMPVMEGKCALFKAFGDVDAIPLCVRSKEVDDMSIQSACWLAVLAVLTWRIFLHLAALRLSGDLRNAATFRFSTMTSMAQL